MLYQKTKINFFEVQKLAAKESKPHTRPGRMLVVTLATAVLLGLGGWSVWGLWNESSALDSDITAAMAFVENEGNFQAAEQAMETRGLAETLKSYNDKCDQYRSFLQNTDRLGSEHFAKISAELPANTKISAYSYAEGGITVSCVSTDKEEPAAFAKRLSDSESFAGVIYAGFQAQPGENEQSVYTFTITCLFGELLGGEGARQ